MRLLEKEPQGASKAVKYRRIWDGLKGMVADRILSSNSYLDDHRLICFAAKPNDPFLPTHRVHV